MESPDTARPALPIGPPPARNQCHCTVCGQTFSGISLFDRHRRAGRCLDPRDIPDMRLVKGIWRGPAMTTETIRRKGTR